MKKLLEIFLACSLILVLSGVAYCAAPCDLDEDGDLDGLDLAAFAAGSGTECSLEQFLVDYGNIGSLWPLEVGKLWQYDVKDNNLNTWTMTLEVTGIESQCSEEYHRINICDSRNPGVCETTFFRSEEQILYSCNDGVENVQFRTDVPFYGEWISDPPDDGPTYITRLPDENVTVPYGDYLGAYYFHSDEGPLYPDCNVWNHLVQGVGLVKQQDECTDEPEPVIWELADICDDPNPESPGNTCPCIPDCTGRECGDDGCGGSCGSCADGEACNEEGICRDMAQVPPGCFNMGDAFAEGSDEELPVHEVCITAFEMDFHEITNAEYAECVDDGACTVPGDIKSNTQDTYYSASAYDNFPVIYVDWLQVNEYCTWAGKRLPTEAEWEYAARGGLAGNRYPWGDEIRSANANYNQSYIWDTSMVESYAPNDYGLYDMAGNVMEWTADWHDPTYYLASPVLDPQGPASGLHRVLRGGSWRFSASGLRVAARFLYNPASGSDAFGGRCARDVP